MFGLTPKSNGKGDIANFWMLDTLNWKFLNFRESDYKSDESLIRVKVPQYTTIKFNFLKTNFEASWVMQQREGKFYTKTYHEICKKTLILKKNKFRENNQVP